MHFLLTAKFFLLFKTSHFTLENTLVLQTVKNLPAMQETWVPSLGGEDPLEEGMATHSSILAWRESHGQRSLAGLLSTHRGVRKRQTQLSD